MRLRPGAIEQYRELHRAVWPELEDELRRCGISAFSIFEADPLLIVYSTVESEDAWERAWASDVHQRWGELMRPLLEFDGDVINAQTLECVYRLPPRPGA